MGQKWLNLSHIWDTFVSALISRARRFSRPGSCVSVLALWLLRSGSCALVLAAGFLRPGSRARF